MPLVKFKDPYAIDSDDLYDYEEALGNAIKDLMEDKEDEIEEAKEKVKEQMEKQFSMFLPGVNGVYNHPFWHGTYIDWYLDGKTSISNVSMITGKKFIPSAAAIIIGKKKVISYERHSTPDKMWQSTLDIGNQARVTGKPITFGDETSSSNLWMWAYKKSNLDLEHTFYPVNSKTIAAGRIVLPLLAEQGMIRPNVIFVNDDEITSVMSAKQYLETLRNADAIYNLQGVRVLVPQKGKLYIKGGKKFIQK